MKKREKGYSLLVLIIAVIVILIITAGVITTINVSMEEKEINNFIYDLNNIEASAKQYYSNTGLIPNLGEIAVPSEFGPQLDENDGNTYYTLDLEKLNVVNVHEPEKTYIINKDSLRVYAKEGVEYRGVMYYTVTDALMGVTGKYNKQDLDVQFTLNPTIWSKRVDIKMTIPNKTNDDTSSWIFKWSIGPKNLEFFQTGGEVFNYEDNISIYTNGVYSIYISDGENETVKNVVVRNVDDIEPKYKIQNGNITLMDDETGIQEVRYKLRSEYDSNKTKFDSEKEPLDYYLVAGEGNLIESIKEDMEQYAVELEALELERDSLNAEYDALTPEEQAMQIESYDASLREVQNKLSDLDTKYAHILDDDIEYVLYIKDYAGNGTILLDKILTFRKVRETFNIENTLDE